MTQNAIFDVVKRHLLAIMPELRPESVTLSASMRDLGANSIDRVEVAMGAMEELRIKVPSQELAGSSSLKDLVNLLEKYST